MLNLTSFSESTGTSSSSDYYINYLIFCCTFSVLHGAVDGVLAFTVPYLGASLGGIGNGLMYITYAISCVFIADPCVSFFGSKKAVLIGMLLLLLYTLSVCFSIFLRPIKWYLFPLGAICGGFGAGIIWTSQGAYYVKNSLEYSKALLMEFTVDNVTGTAINGNSNGSSSSDGSGEEEVPSSTTQTLQDPGTAATNTADKTVTTDSAGKTNTVFASIFAFCYLGFETVIISFATLVYYTNGGTGSNNSSDHVPIWQYVVFGVYGSIAAAAYIMAFVCLRSWKDSINSSGMIVNSYKSAIKLIMSYMYTHFLHVQNLLFQHRDIKLLMPYQFTFGMVTALFISYILGDVIATDNHMEGYIGVLGAIVTLVAACVAYPINILTTRYVDLRSKLVIVLIGMSCWALCVIAVLLLPKSDLTLWSGIIPYVVLHGVGRGIWENTNKAIIADIFSSLYHSSSSLTQDAMCSFQYSEVLPTITGSPSLRSSNSGQNSHNSSQNSANEFTVDIEVNNPIAASTAESSGRSSDSLVIEATEVDHLNNSSMVASTSTSGQRAFSSHSLLAAAKIANINDNNTAATSDVHNVSYLNSNSIQNAEFINSQEKSDVTAAYANVYFFSGLGGAVGFFLFAYVTDLTTILYLNMLCLILSYICCIALYIQI